MDAPPSAVASSSSLISTQNTQNTQDPNERRIRLRLCYGGSFVLSANGTYRYTGGEYYNESVSADSRYADFLYKLTEKFKTAVSVKYQCPGEEMDPSALITVADDDDFAELKEEYFAHLLRPGTPSKTFRIRCFAFPASEEPLTPDEILEGECFFSHDMPASSTSRGGGAPFDSALEQQALLHSMVGAGAAGDVAVASVGMPSSAAAAAYSSWVAAGGAAASSAEMERTALERMRMSVNNLSDFNLGAALAGAGAWRCGGGPGSEPVDAEVGYDAADEEEAEVAAYWERHGPGLQDAVAGARPAAGAAAAPGAPGSARAAQLLPADPFDQEGSLVEASSGGFAVRDAGAGGGDKPSGGFSFSLMQESEGGTGLGGAALGPGGEVEVEVIAAAKATWGGEPLGGTNLPSYISAFGDAVDGEAAAGAAAAGGAEGMGIDDGVGGYSGGAGAAAQDPAGRPGWRGGRGGGANGGYVPRTQDSGFSLEGERPFGGAGDGSNGGGGGPPERADSGDSLQSLPKLQPVHLLTRAEVKVLAKIGEGAFGEVSRAQAPLYGTVAVKWLKTERFSKHSASFWREAALLADLNHPNVLRFYGVITDAPAAPGHGAAEPAAVVGIMTEYVRGGSLAQFLRAGRGPLPLRLRCELALQAANGLAYLHELRIVHFDLKPDNLLLDGPAALVLAAAQAGAAGGGGEADAAAAAAAGRAGGGVGLFPAEDFMSELTGGASEGLLGGGGAHRRGPSTTSGAAGGGSSAAPAAGDAALAQAVVAGWVPTVKVADFGLSKHKLNSYVSSCRDLRGTLPYMAPELVADPERVSEKADVWSMGVVMWEMLMREMPYQDLTPQQILMGLMTGGLTLDIPPWCDAEWRGLVEACLEPNPARRPSMKELARQLEAIRDQQAAAAAAEAAAAASECVSRRASSTGCGGGGGLTGAAAVGGGGAVASAAAAAAALDEAVSAAGAAAAHMQQHHQQQAAVLLQTQAQAPHFAL